MGKRLGGRIAVSFCGFGFNLAGPIVLGTSTEATPGAAQQYALCNSLDQYNTTPSQTRRLERYRLDDKHRGLLGNTYAYGSRSSSCGSNVAYNGPMGDILNAYRELTLRISVAAAAEGRVVDTDEAGISQSEAYSQNVPYTGERVRIQYAADRGNLAVAVVVSVLGPVATLTLFWGWWRLGRSFSLSPLEIANAFGAPMSADEHSLIDVLVNGSSNALGDEPARHVKGAGDPMVRYAVGDGDRLFVALAAQDGVRTP